MDVTQIQKTDVEDFTVENKIYNISSMPAQNAQKQNREARFFNFSPDLLCIIDFNGNLQQFNPSWEHTLGHTALTLCGKSWMKLIHPEDLKRSLTILKKLTQDILSLCFENRLICKDGSYRWFCWTVESDVQDGLIYATGHDITEHKKREYKLQRIVEVTATKTTTEFFRACVRSIAETLQVRCVLITELTDQKKTRLRTLAVWNGVDFREDFEYDLGKTPCENVIAGKTCFYASQVQNDFPEVEILKDLNIQSYWGIPLQDSQDNVIGNFVLLDTKPMSYDPSIEFILKISVARAGAELERKRAEEKLKESQRFIEEITEFNPNVIYIYDLLEQRNVFINHNIAIALGYSKTEILQMGSTVLKTLMHPEDFAQLPRHYQEIDQGADSQLFEINYRMRHKNGSWYWFNSREKIFARSSEGKPKQILGTATDITQLKQQTEELTQNTRKLALKSEIGLALVQGGDLSNILNTCTKALIKYLKGAVQIWTLNPVENVLELQASAGMYTEINHAYRRIPVGRFKIGLIAAEKKPYLTNDIFQTPKLNNPAWIKQEKIAAFAGYPLLIEDRVVGVLAMFSRDSFCQDTLDDLALIANEIAIGIERKQAEQALAKELLRIQVLFDTSFDGIVILDNKGKVLDANPRFAEMLGYTLEETTTLNVFDWDAYFTPEEHQKSLQDRINRNGGVLETQHRRKDGSIYDVEISYNVVEWEGETLRFCVCRDISERQASLRERKKAEEEKTQLIASLQKLAHQLNEAQRIAHIGNWEFEVTTGAITWSDELFHIYQKPLGKIPTFDEILQQIYPEDRERWLQQVQDAMESGIPYDIDHKIFLPSGEIRHINGKGQAVKNEWGQIVGLFGTAMDITERKRAEEALRESEARERLKAAELEQTINKLKSTQAQLVQQEKMAGLGQLVAGIAHEINNPISFIYGNITPAGTYTEDLFELIDCYQKHYPNHVPEIANLMEKIDLPFIKNDFHDLLESMKEGASRIKKIVLSLRNFSRFDEAEVKEADIHSGIDSTLMILQHRFKEQPNRKAIEVVRHYSQLPSVECYPSQLNQVFMNILANAIDALETKLKSDENLVPRIVISTELKIDSVKQIRSAIVIRIKDNGIGILPEIKDQIFNPFFTTKSVGSGTGLGLSISYQIIVDQHQGKLKCKSQVGQGSEFMIVIPNRLFSANF